MELSIIIPAYNEEKRLPPTLQKIFRHLEEHHYDDFELVVANDGSKDHTADIVREFAKKHPRLRVLDYGENRGRGAVCKAAIPEVGGYFILITEADGSTSEQSILPFARYLKEHADVDILVGSRDIEGARIVFPQPPFRIFLNKVFLLMAGVLFGWPMHDRVNGFKMFRREAALDVYPHQTETSFFAEAEIIYIAEDRGWKVRELPIVWADDRDSRVKPIRESLHAFLGMFKIFIRGKTGFYKKSAIFPFQQ